MSFDVIKFKTGHGSTCGKQARSILEVLVDILTGLGPGLDSAEQVVHLVAFLPQGLGGSCAAAPATAVNIQRV